MMTAKFASFLIGLLLMIITLDIAVLAIVSYGDLKNLLSILFCLSLSFTTYWVVEPMDKHKRRKVRKPERR